MGTSNTKESRRFNGKRSKSILKSENMNMNVFASDFERAVEYNLKDIAVQANNKHRKFTDFTSNSNESSGAKNMKKAARLSVNSGSTY